MSIYFDHNATTPMDPRVVDSMLPYLHTHHGNPSSVSKFGRITRAAIDQAREQVASLVNVVPSQVVFTSGGTEANNLAINGVAEEVHTGRIAISAIEHSSVSEPVFAMRNKGYTVDIIPVDDQSIVQADLLPDILQEDTRMVSVMLANNETGVLQDVGPISEQVRSHGAIFHTDAVQAVGKIKCDFDRTGAHLMSLSAHKIYGPKGVGALIIDKLIEIPPLLRGGGHEMGRRAGTENVAAIVGFGIAAEIAGQELVARTAHLLSLRKYLESRLKMMAGVVIFADNVRRLVNTVFISIPGIDGETLLMQLDRQGIAVSSGSACSSHDSEPSHVLLAMGVNEDVARNAIRISLGKDNTHQEVDQFARALEGQIDQLRMTALTAWG